ncbi:MAG TPA: right-handed parallel beta-helix repeat-containing protein [Solirubrobacterales bacterium]|nr:right-handed parallel beta-helix repeat-containing protein [Solirubrobacterales bacterium]
MPVEGAGKLLDCRVLLAAALVCACALAAPALATAEQFRVDTTADEVDAVLGNETCLTAAGKCSLRAALEEANATPGEFDEVRFEEEVFEGDADSVVELASPLPTIVAPLTLAGPECETEAGVVGPCAEISGDPSVPALAVEGVEEVTIELVAVTGAEVGIELVEAERFWLRSNWIGTSLDGGPAGNDTGILVGPGSDRSRVGGEGPGAGNLIANNSGVGLEIRGASNVRVLGNRLGVTPAGTAAAANGSNVAVSSAAASVALENTIGTRVSPEAAATPACDGGCNLISGSAGPGIDLSGSGGSGPPVATTIAGNLVGFDATGEGTIANDEAGAYVGAAPQTTVGGAKAGDANRFAGGPAAIESGPAPGLAIRGNLIGLRAGPSVSPPSTGGILVDSTGLQFPAQEVSILANEIGLEGGAGISLQGSPATISGNRIEGAETGIRVREEAGGSLLAGNVVDDAEGSGILLESGGNEVFDNQVAGAGGAGIRLAGAAPFGINANLVGGNTAATENVIDGSGGPAIEIESVEKSWNEVARNRGSGNAGRFIELLPADPEPGDPNDGTQPPPIASISATAAAGFAEPGAVVRVFRKASSSPGEVESFLGETVADGVGNWSLAFPALPAGTGVAATQTLNGGTSELEIAAVPLADGSQLAPSGSDGGTDSRPPRTRMLKQPRRVRAGGVARFSFTANEPGSSFQCSLDRGQFRPCRSPKKYRLSRPGKHLFRVRAVDPAGNVDPTPVRRRFEVLD